MPNVNTIDINATTRNKNVVTKTGIEPHPEQPNQPESPAENENRKNQVSNPDVVSRHPAGDNFRQT